MPVYRWFDVSSGTASCRTSVRMDGKNRRSDHSDRRRQIAGIGPLLRFDILRGLFDQFHDRVRLRNIHRVAPVYFDHLRTDPL